MTPESSKSETLRHAEWTGWQVASLVALRLLVGWHFLYEGVAKLANPYWTSAEYINQAKWLFQKTFTDIAANPGAVTIVDQLNSWGLTLIGLGLVLGLFTRTAASSGILVLLLYYIVAPPLVGLSYAMPTEGSYLVVNKVLIEAAAMLVLLLFPTGRRYGLDRFIAQARNREARTS